MFQPMMTQMQGFHDSLHSDIAALDSRFEDLPSSEQLEQRQEQLEQRFDAFSTTFTGFTDHLYSVFPAPVPPPEFYPHQPFYPPPPPPPPMDWPSWQLMPKGEKELWSAWSRGSSWTSHGNHSLSASACYSCLFVLNYCITCLWFVSCMNSVWDLCLDLNIWFVICDELC